MATSSNVHSRSMVCETKQSTFSLRLGVLAQPSSLQGKSHSRGFRNSPSLHTAKLSLHRNQPINRHYWLRSDPKYWRFGSNDRVKRQLKCGRFTHCLREQGEKERALDEYGIEVARRRGGKLYDCDKARFPRNLSFELPAIFWFLYSACSS